MLDGIKPFWASAEENIEVRMPLREIYIASRICIWDWTWPLEQLIGPKYKIMFRFHVEEKPCQVHVKPFHVQEKNSCSREIAATHNTQILTVY